MSEQKVKVVLGQYRGLAAVRPEVIVEEAEVNSEVQRLISAYSNPCLVLDRPVAVGDKVIIDFEGFKDGVPFAGGKGSDYPLVIGSHSFIDTFEDQLIGAEVGSRVEVHVTFPAQYGAAELAGKPATFQVDVKGIQVDELPELNDELVQDHFDCENVAEFLQNVRDQIREGKEIDFTDARRQDLLNRIVESSVIEYPEEMLNEAIGQIIEGIEMNMQQQGMNLEQYMQMTGMTLENIRAQVRPQAEKEFKTRQVLEAIAREEKFRVTEEEEEFQMMQFSRAYGIPVEQVKQMLHGEAMEMVRGDICVNKAVQLIMETAVDL